MAWQEPTLVPGLTNIRTAACGTHHSMFLSESGEVSTAGSFFPTSTLSPSSQQSDSFLHTVLPAPQVFACGKNSKGQLGLSSLTPPVQRTPVLVPELSGIGASMIACGDAHTLVLVRPRSRGEKGGRVLAMGSNLSGQLGIGKPGVPPEQGSGIVEVQGLGGVDVLMVAAGGEQSFAIAMVGANSKEGVGMDEASLDLIRKFSVVKPPTVFCSTGALQLMVGTKSCGLGDDGVPCQLTSTCSLRC